MDPMFLGLSTDIEGQENPTFNSANLLHREGVPQESKLATYLRNREVLNNQPLHTPDYNENSSTLQTDLKPFECDPGPSTQEMRNSMAEEWKPRVQLSDNSGSSQFGAAFTMPGTPTSSSVVTAAGDTQTSSFTEDVVSGVQQKLASDPSLVAPTYHENVGGTTYFYTAKDMKYKGSSAAPNTNSISTRDAAQSIYSQYSIPTASRSNVPDQLLADDDLRLEMLERQSRTHEHHESNEFKNIPHEVDLYYELVPLEHLSAASKPMMNYATSVYKATHVTSGSHHCLYRVHNYRLSNFKVAEIFDAWKLVKHSSLVQLSEVFTTKAFGDHSIIFVYELHMGSETLDQRFLSNGYSKTEWDVLSSSTDVSASRMLSESSLWNFVIQLTGVIRTIHTQGLSCRTLTPSKILLTDSRSRIRLNCCAIVSVLSFDPNTQTLTSANQPHQQEDLVNLGKLMVALACRSYVSIQRDNLAIAMDLIGRVYSRDFSMLCVCLLTSQRVKNINDIMPMIGARFYGALDTAIVRADSYESELNKELDNGRLFRLITKLNTIVDRAYLKMDRSWSETGDRFMLKLFQDYVFHQYTEDGKPWLDMGHMVSTLNKFDCGSPDKVCLMSPDQLNVLVVSYKELKHAFERTFQELLQVGSIPKLSLKSHS